LLARVVFISSRKWEQIDIVSPSTFSSPGRYTIQATLGHEPTLAIDAIGGHSPPDRYDDGGFTGGNMERPALKRLMADIEAGRVDCVVVYKVDRLSRSLLDFAQLMGKFDKHQIAFVSVTQQFNTTNSMGRLMLNVLLSFAQFERELISERSRDKIAATRRKGKWCGGLPPLGYDVVSNKLVINPIEAEQVRSIFDLYLQHEGLIAVVRLLQRIFANRCGATGNGV
jgi:site-specific DNA recombinase